MHPFNIPWCICDRHKKDVQSGEARGDWQQRKEEREGGNGEGEHAVHPPRVTFRTSDGRRSATDGRRSDHRNSFVVRRYGGVGVPKGVCWKVDQRMGPYKQYVEHLQVPVSKELFVVCMV